MWLRVCWLNLKSLHNKALIHILQVIVEIVNIFQVKQGKDFNILAMIDLGKKIFSDDCIHSAS